MLNLFANFFTLLQLEQISVDNQIFRLHYRATASILVIFSILVGSKEHFGLPIQCHMPGKAVEEAFINAYCWIHPTYTVDKLQHGNSQITISQGVGHTVLGEDSVTYVKYYQWVGVMLLLQALLFYGPHFLWSCWEGGRVQMLCRDLADPLLGPEWNEQRRAILAEYLSNRNADMHNIYAAQYAFCEALNLLNVLGQIYLLNTFFQGSFFGYGMDLMKYSLADGSLSSNPMDKLFPRLTKCTYRKFGPSGGVMPLDALCVLPLNSLNQKIFAIIWFWLMILTVLSTVAAAYRAALIASPALRSLMILCSTRQLSRTQVIKLTSSLSFGCWFMLSQLSKNVHPAVYRELLSELYANLNSNVKRLKPSHIDAA